MLLIWGRGNVNVLKCLMGAGRGSWVRTTNEKVWRRAGVSAQAMRALLEVSNFFSYSTFFSSLFSSSSLVYMHPVGGSRPSGAIRASFVHLVFPVCKKLLNGTAPHGGRRHPLLLLTFSSHTHTVFPLGGSGQAGFSFFRHPIMTYHTACCHH